MPHEPGKDPRRPKNLGKTHTRTRTTHKNKGGRLMTVVAATDFYEYLIHNDTATCEGCGKEMQLPDKDDSDAGMKEPFWHHEEVHTYIGGNFDEKHAYCKECIQEEVDA